jgi:16S rRNA (adenine1518-N6/adenine1519-N6)-dimethyltransferase
VVKVAKTTTHRPRKRFGQHFLEPVWVDKVIRAIDPHHNETFIEIGAGRGALTFPLARQARAVVAYEIDRDLVARLRAHRPENVSIVADDFLHSRERPVFDEGTILRVAGNLPYNVASPMLFKLLDMYAQPHPAGLRPADATVMIQREVADRLAAAPATREYGVLSVLVGYRADVDRLLELPPGAFRPPPLVSSTVVRLRFHEAASAVRDPQLFERIVQAVFTRRRKTLANALRAFQPGEQQSSRLEAQGSGLPRQPSPAAALDRAGIDGRRRPETLTIDEFARLADAYADSLRGV